MGESEIEKYRGILPAITSDAPPIDEFSRSVRRKQRASVEFS